jgi:hypothetical protein
MAYDYAMNIHVLDADGVPVPGVTVRLYVDGVAVLSGKTTGYANQPLKLRFNCKVPRLLLKAEFEGKTVEREVLVTERDATLQLDWFRMPKPASDFQTQNWFAFAFGCVMLVVLLLLPFILPATLPPYIEKFYSKIPLTLLSLGAAGFGAALTGFLLVQIGTQNNLIRGGGALGMFLVVFFWNPAGM